MPSPTRVRPLSRRGTRYLGCDLPLMTCHLAGWQHGMAWHFICCKLAWRCPCRPLEYQGEGSQVNGWVDGWVGGMPAGGGACGQRVGRAGRGKGVGTGRPLNVRGEGAWGCLSSTWLQQQHPFSSTIMQMALRLTIIQSNMIACKMRESGVYGVMTTPRAPPPGPRPPPFPSAQTNCAHSDDSPAALLNRTDRRWRQSSGAVMGDINRRKVLATHKFAQQQPPFRQPSLQPRAHDGGRGAGVACARPRGWAIASLVVDPCSAAPRPACCTRDLIAARHGTERAAATSRWPAGGGGGTWLCACRLLPSCQAPSPSYPPPPPPPPGPLHSAVFCGSIAPSPPRPPPLPRRASSWTRGRSATTLSSRRRFVQRCTAMHRSTVRHHTVLCMPPALTASACLRQSTVTTHRHPGGRRRRRTATHCQPAPCRPKQLRPVRRSGGSGALC